MQFGMLVEHVRDVHPNGLLVNTRENDTVFVNVGLGNLVALYRAAKRRFDSDKYFQLRARQCVLKLQNGEDARARATWETLCHISRMEYNEIYDLLNIHNLIERGESFYNLYLKDVVQELHNLDLAVESEGAMVVFLKDTYHNLDGSPLPIIVRKSDGAYNYATTDLAAIRHRTSMESGERADRVLYVTDVGQSQHFDMVFELARKAKFVPDNVSLEHVPFGLVQDKDGKKFATRSGESVKLKDLLQEAMLRVEKDISNRNNDNFNLRPTNADGEYGDRDIQNVIQTVAIGAVKYADLSMNRKSNYRFSHRRMLSLKGNTAPYMLYAYARICGIVRKANVTMTMRNDETNIHGEAIPIDWPKSERHVIILVEDSELQLVRNLVKLPDILREVERDLYPNRLCDFLFETSQRFNKFYETCPVNHAESLELKYSRLKLCIVTANTIRLIMGFLGIQVLERL